MKAIVLLSGGLDSSLALKMMIDQGIEVIALHFTSSFCTCDGSGACGSASKKISDFVGAKLKIVRMGQDYLDMIKAPKHGYGKNMNPCIDCRIMKFKYAKKIMEESGASFVVTGEVLGQRPMSQHRKAMDLIEKESALEGLVVRPLCAKMIEPSIPETNGWVDREKLLDIHGRTRKPQIQLAKDLGISDYPCPAGGCLLTDSGFAGRLRDLIAYGNLDDKNAELLKVGRQFRISPEFKLIVGRNEKENTVISALATRDDILFEPPEELPGPIAMGRGNPLEEDMALSGVIMAHYIKTDTDGVEVFIKEKGQISSRNFSKKDYDTKAVEEIRL